jgi:hypothetical protein
LHSRQINTNVGIWGLVEVSVMVFSKSLAGRKCRH